MPSRSALNQVGLQAAGHRVELDAEGRHRPVVDHVVGLDLHDDVLVHRHDDLVVDGEEPRLARLQIGLLHDDRIEGDALVGIFVGPVPLIAGGGDGEVGLGEIVLGEQQPERRDGDGDQDQNRHHRPGDLERRVVGGAGGLGIALLVEADHHVDEQAENEQRDHGDDDGDVGMERGDLLHDRRGGLLEAHLPRRRLTIAGIGRAAHRRGSPPRQDRSAFDRRSPFLHS